MSTLLHKPPRSLAHEMVDDATRREFPAGAAVLVAASCGNAGDDEAGPTTTGAAPCRCPLSVADHLYVFASEDDPAKATSAVAALKDQPVWRTPAVRARRQRPRGAALLVRLRGHRGHRSARRPVEHPPAPVNAPAPASGGGTPAAVAAIAPAVAATAVVLP